MVDYLVYVVASGPHVEKISGEKFFYTYKSAHDCWDNLDERFKYNFSIYEAYIRVNPDTFILEDGEY